MVSAWSIRIRGVVQGVGFRPFVYRLAQANSLSGWVLNGEDGVEIHLEGDEESLRAFVQELKAQPPPAASIASIDVKPAAPAGLRGFTIRESQRRERPTVRISPDLAVCDDCLRELFDPADRRYQHPYINCTNCGPRYTVILGLPYDRPDTTMRPWPLDSFCAGEFSDPGNRRFHAQPVACPACGPHYFLQDAGEVTEGDGAAIGRAAKLLKAGKILAVKGLGGYHLACDALNSEAVATLRTRKYHKEKPFALMAKNLEVARKLIELSPEAADLLYSVARPIVLAPARTELPGVAPDNGELGVMLPYAPLHHLLFEHGAPEILVMTSANRSSEPIAYTDQDALQLLSGIADAYLIGQRSIARRVDDSVVRAGPIGPAILRRARGYAPSAVATLPADRPILALGADLKNTITLAVDGQAFVSQHIGDLDHYPASQAFEETIRDLISMYGIPWSELLVVSDCHPQYYSANYARGLPAREKRTIQHHRAHVASVLAEKGEWEKQVLGVSFDGTGYGDDGAIWGGELFCGSVKTGFSRVAHLRVASQAGGDAAAQHPVQAAAGFLAQLERFPDFTAEPFSFPHRFRTAMQLVEKGVRVFPTTSVGRLFDAAAALLGFTREITFEGQAAMWVEHLAGESSCHTPYPFPFAEDELDFRPLLQAVVDDRLRNRPAAEIARAFQRAVAQGLCHAIRTLCSTHQLDTVVLSGGVFQNRLLQEDLSLLLRNDPVEVWMNHAVPPNDGGISLGQAALASFGRFDSQESEPARISFNAIRCADFP